MSSHVIEDNELRWIFGWNQRYRSFYLTKHDKTLTEEDNPIFQIGIRPREIPDEEGLFTLATMVGFDIPYEYKVELYKDKEQEKRTYFVLHYPNAFVAGFETDILAHAELLKDALERARPDEELQIRQITGLS
jgi:hypothetical protein